MVYVDSKNRVGRPCQEPTEVVSIRLPVKTIELIQRRAGKARMPISVYLANRVIYHEVIRSHHGKKEAPP